MIDPPAETGRTRVLHGDRIGRLGSIRTGCSAIIFNADRTKVLLTRRADTGQWCLPGGGAEPGESVSEACIREVREETGLEVAIVRLIGIYSTPDMLTQYPDGVRVQFVSLCFEASVISGTPSLSDETTEYGYFSPSECDSLELFANHRERIQDAFENMPQPVIR